MSFLLVKDGNQFLFRNIFYKYFGYNTGELLLKEIN